MYMHSGQLLTMHDDNQTYCVTGFFDSPEEEWYRVEGVDKLVQRNLRVVPDYQLREVRLEDLADAETENVDWNDGDAPNAGSVASIDKAYARVQSLRRTIEEGRDVRPGLAVSLELLARAYKSCGQEVEAGYAIDRATILRQQLTNESGA
ncbi:MAG: hypothetical protein IKG18_08240 [Atopobiaceae bacterium]|nr:hypothetical protein [Atopobiaceae bacterium]